jgi:hypothetical protein
LHYDVMLILENKDFQDHMNDHLQHPQTNV